MPLSECEGRHVVAAGETAGTLEQPLQRTLPGMGGGGGRWGADVNGVSEL